MKKVIIIICIAIVLVLIVFLSIFFAKKTVVKNIKTNNEESADALITKVYSKEKIDKFIEKVEAIQTKSEKNISYYDFQIEFKPECIRNGANGCIYVVLKQDDGSKVFVFFNSEYEIKCVRVYDGFISVKEFESILDTNKIANKEITTEMLSEFEKYNIPSPISSVKLNFYIVKEGALMVTLNRDSDLQEKTDNEYVESISFISNERLMNQENATAFFHTFYETIILAIDKA